MKINKSELRVVPITDIKVSERFRKDYGDIEELVESIKENGILQPISLNANLELAAGGRRYVAAATAGLTEIPAIIRDTTDNIDRLEVELFENIHRQDMRWDEEVALTKAIDDLYKEKHGKDWSGRKTAELLNKSRGGVAENLKLAKALETVPELKKCKTKNDAQKILKKAGKKVVVEEKRAEQKERIEREGLSNLARAETNFRIGNCFIGMQETIDLYKEMESPSMVKLIEVDPPYAIDLADIKKKEGITSEELKKYEEISKENYPHFLERLSKLLFEVAASDSWTIFWFGPTWFTEVKAALVNAGFKVDDIPGIWVKGSEDSEGYGQTNQPKYYLARSYEPFFIARKGNPEIRKQGRSNVFSFKPLAGEQKYHPTQRPIELISEILQTFAYPGDLVLVPFLGSGTTLRAAYKNEMNAMGWELNSHNKDYFMLKVEEDERC